MTNLLKLKDKANVCGGIETYEPGMCDSILDNELPV